MVAVEGGATPWDFEGMAEILDAFVTAETVELNIRAKFVLCVSQHHGALIFELSPQSLDHGVWQTSGRDPRRFSLRQVDCCSSSGETSSHDWRSKIGVMRVPSSTGRFVIDCSEIRRLFFRPLLVTAVSLSCVLSWFSLCGTGRGSTQTGRYSDPGGLQR